MTKMTEMPIVETNKLCIELADILENAAKILRDPENLSPATLEMMADGMHRTGSILNKMAIVKAVDNT